MTQHDHQDMDSDEPENYDGGESRKLSALPYLITIVLLVIALGTAIAIIVVKTSGGSEAKKAAQNTEQVQQAKDNETVVDGNVVDVDKVNGNHDEGEADVDDTDEDETANATEEDSADSNREKIDPESPVSKIALTLQSYYAAPTIEKKLKYVIDPERVAPLMRDYYSRNPFRPVELASMSVPSALPFGGFAFWKVETFFKGGNKGFVALRFINDSPKVDWESEVRYSTMDWDKWTESTGEDEGDFRVYAIEDQYSAPPFTDMNRYMCLKLNRLDSSRSAFAFVDTTNIDMIPLLDLMRQGQLTECTLRLKKVKSTDSAPIAKVVKLLSTSWIVVSHGEDDAKAP